MWKITTISDRVRIRYMHDYYQREVGTTVNFTLNSDQALRMYQLIENGADGRVTRFLDIYQGKAFLTFSNGDGEVDLFLPLARFPQYDLQDAAEKVTA